VIIVVMMCVLLVTLVSLALLRLAGTQHRQTELVQRQLQAEWLADAGLQRGRSRLAGDAPYHGETWDVPPDVLGRAGAVVIAVTNEPGATDSRQLEAQAVFPSDSDQRAQVTRRERVSSPTATETGGAP
jgi:hypothetical protein